MRDKQHETTKGYILVRTHVYWLTEQEGSFPFRKDKMSPQTCVLYLTEDAANRALSQIYRGEEYTIVPVDFSQSISYTTAR